MAEICEIKARQVFDSRGDPTVEAEIWLTGGGSGRFICPAGASCGRREAVELRDGDEKRFLGRGVTKAVANIRDEIAEAILHRGFADQAELDGLLLEIDGTDNKSRLGANAILAVSGAFFHAMAAHLKMPLYESVRMEGPRHMPIPLVNVINGGAHANNGLDVQEFMLVPLSAVRFSEALRMIAETFYALKSLLRQQGLSTAVGDEGGFAPALMSNEQALDLLTKAVLAAGLLPGRDMGFALDVAASSLYDDSLSAYRINDALLNRDELFAWYEMLIRTFPICSIEDPFHEDDGLGFAHITSRLGKKIQVVGDDIFVTNEAYIAEGIERGYANAVLIKINQIGTITETLAAIGMAKRNGLAAIVSHRSGDSEDTTIADLAVLARAEQIKTGSICRSERVAKYNRLLRIEEEIGDAKLVIPRWWVRG